MMSMRKMACVAAAAAVASHVSAQLATEAQRQFIRGSIADKTAAVRGVPEGDALALARAGLDFAIRNKPLLGNDPALAELAAASAAACPAPLPSAQAEALVERLSRLFALYDDEAVRVAVLDRLAPLCAESGTEQAAALVNGCLQGAREGAATAAALRAAGQVGDSRTFDIVYDAWRTGRWPSLAAETEDALAVLSERSVADAVRAIASSDLREVRAYFTLLTADGKKSPNFRAEIAENALSKAIYTTEDLSGSMDGTISLQAAAVRVIAESRWVRASQLVIRYFSLAREEYEAGVLEERTFGDVILCMSQLASPDTTQALSSYLADLNRLAEGNVMPAKPVVLAVITALGALGDKSAFDNLLYVTYLPYPQDVAAAARAALAKLKW